MYGRKYQKGLNVVTTVAMIGFHAGAIAALFFIDGGAMLSALALYASPACWASAWATTAC